MGGVRSIPNITPWHHLAMDQEEDEPSPAPVTADLDRFASPAKRFDAPLELIGYWRNAFNLNWPDPRAFVDDSWDATARRDVVAYLRHGAVARTFWGASICRFCEAENGSIELTDDRFIWPEGFAHYVESHGVRPPFRFTEHVRSYRARPLEIDIDDRWWKSLRNGPIEGDRPGP